LKIAGTELMERMSWIGCEKEVVVVLTSNDEEVFQAPVDFKN